MVSQKRGRESPTRTPDAVSRRDGDGPPIESFRLSWGAHSSPVPPASRVLPVIPLSPCTRAEPNELFGLRTRFRRDAEIDTRGRVWSPFLFRGTD